MDHSLRSQVQVDWEG